MPRYLTAALIALALPAQAADVVTYATEDAFDDASFAVESAIVGRGLVIDYVSHVGEMLARTKEDVGGTVDIFDAADIYLFCSAAVSRQVMEADPMNIIHCPYRIFVADKGGEVTVGYGAMPEGAMQAVQELLESIAREAVDQ
ncbi:MAG: DUF302 domain-containing protein [Rhodobacteraceae bacterium]|nr:DUF302 domain-containing protein [Paracoccaceae bacterium]